MASDPIQLTPGLLLMGGALCLFAAVEPRLGLALIGVLLIVRGYIGWVADSGGPLDDGETLLMEVGEEGEPDRPVRIRDLNRPEEETTDKG